MHWPGFIGAAYTSQALAAAGERCVNLYPERIEAQTGSNPAQAYLVAVPGYSAFATLPKSPIQHMVVANNGTLYVIAGGEFYEVSAAAVITHHGSAHIPSGGIHYRSADNGNELLIVNDGHAWLYTYATHTFVGLTGLDDPIDCAFIDGYFLALKRDSRQFQLSGIMDGTTWDALDFAVAEGAGDNINAIFADHRELWLFGERRTEVFYNSGNPDSPFERLPGGFIEHGCAAPQSIAKLDNSLVWLGGDARGAGMCWRANGYTPQRISNHAVEWIWSQYERIDDAVAFAYQEMGHQFYVLHFPSARPTRIMADGHPSVGYAGATWVYDAAIGMWHERAYWDQVNGVEGAHRGRYHAFAFGRHLLGDYTSGALYEQAADTYSFAGAPRRWLRSAPYLSNEGRMMRYDALEVQMLSGQGLATGQGMDPLIWLEQSNDGGFTWGASIQAGMGKIGETTYRARWRRLGRSRRRAFRVWGSDPVRTVLLDAWAEVRPGVS